MDRFIDILCDGIRPVERGFEIDFEADYGDDVVYLTKDNTRRPRTSPREGGSTVAKYSAFKLNGEPSACAAFRKIIKNFDVDKLHGVSSQETEKGQYAFETLMDIGAERFLKHTGLRKST